MSDNDELLKEVHTGVNEIRTALFGPEDQKELGYIHRTNATIADYGHRISSLEKYKWQLAGGVIVLAYIAEKILHATQ